MTISLSDPRNHWMVRLWEDYCAKFSFCAPAEVEVDEVDSRRNSMMEEWQSYASTFGVAAPEDQLSPDTWGGDLPVPDEKGEFTPHIVKNWRFWSVRRKTCSDLICMDVVYLKHNSGVALRTMHKQIKCINLVIY
ncbi:MAG: hypothetical protein WBG50_21665 [Desulfomonilaceae bacterium]